MLGDDLSKPRLAILRAVDEGLICGLDERTQLLDGRLAELGRRLCDEIGPERARIFIARTLGGFGQVDELLDETERGQLARP